MSGRQYNMYNSQTAEAWKQRVQKENMHNAPSLRQFSDLNVDDDDDTRSVSSLGQGSTTSGVTRDSRASIASTAALKRVRAPSCCPHRSQLATAVATVLCCSGHGSRLAASIPAPPVRCRARQIEELEAKLETERKKRQEIEDQLKEVQTVVKQASGK